MKDKEVIIDGADVSGCEYSILRSNELKCRAENSDIHVCLQIVKSKCPIYRLKRHLQRKTQECKELKKELNKYANCINKGDAIINTVMNMRLEQHESIIDRYKQALEEIEREVNKPITYRKSEIIIGAYLDETILGIIRKAFRSC